MSTNLSQGDCSTAIKNYISNIIRSNKKASLADFIEDNLEFVVANTNSSEDYKNNWISQFNRAAKDFEADVYERPPNWTQVEEALAERAIILSPSQPTPNTPTDSTEQAKKLNADDKKRIAAVYDKMIQSKMWKLETGKYVEKEMKLVALEQEYEHPVHSVIMDPTDPIWEKRFNAEELHELRNYTVPVIPELPAPLEQFVESFEGKETLDDLYYHVRGFRYHPVHESELHWMQLTVEEALTLLYHGYFEKNRTEADLIRRAWTFMDSCFDSSEYIVSNSGEKASKATSEAQNKDRPVGGDKSIIRNKVGTKVDQLFATPLFELGAMEAGAKSDRSSSKSITELHMKCSKTLKDMAVEIERYNPVQLRQIKICGFIISGLYLQFLVLDCPAGYVSRVTKLPDWLPYPMSAASFMDFFTLLHTLWASRHIMEETKRAVEKKPKKKSTFEAPLPRRLEPSFTSTATKPNYKKRKLSEGSVTPSPSPSSSSASSSSASS